MADTESLLAENKEHWDLIWTAFKLRYCDVPSVAFPDKRLIEVMHTLGTVKPTGPGSNLGKCMVAFGLDTKTDAMPLILAARRDTNHD